MPIVNMDSTWCASTRFHEGLPELQQYVSKHPDNIQGLYELAIGEGSSEPEKALPLLDKILSLDPGFGLARYTRAGLSFEADKLTQSLGDVQPLLKQDPKNPDLLDLLGQIYLKQDRAEDAAQVLKEAAGLAPHNRTILWHYSEVLRKLRRTDEFNAVMAEFRRVSDGDDGSHHGRTGLFDFLNLSPTEQNAKYLAIDACGSCSKSPRRLAQDPAGKSSAGARGSGRGREYLPVDSCRGGR